MVYCGENEKSGPGQFISFILNLAS